jgi:hypothetical protein
MRPLTIGRVLGVGVRVAGRVVSQRIAESAQAAAVGPSQTSAQPARNGQVPPSAARRAGAQGGSVAKGVGGFLRPFSRVGGIVWNEVMGVFFLLPVVAFTPNLWRMRASWAHGPDHTMFLVTAGVVLVFLYLGLSSFWRARRKARGN